MSLYMYTYSMLLNSYSIYIFSQLLRAFKALKKTPQKQRCPCYDNANTMMGHGFFNEEKIVVKNQLLFALLQVSSID